MPKPLPYAPGKKQTKKNTNNHKHCFVACHVPSKFLGQLKIQVVSRVLQKDCRQSISLQNITVDDISQIHIPFTISAEVEDTLFGNSFSDVLLSSQTSYTHVARVGLYEWATLTACSEIFDNHAQWRSKPLIFFTHYTKYWNVHRL